VSDVSGFSLFAAACSIQVARCEEDEDLVQTLRRQVIYKQKKLEVMNATA
jgi:hypothetical protein